MANLKDIRNRIKSVKSIQKVTKAMKMVAAAKMRKAQERMEEARPYANRLEGMINHLLPDVNRESLDLLDVREVKRVGYVVVTSDRGLAGSFNTNVLKTAQNDIDTIGKENVDGKTFLLPRATVAREILANTLRNMGASIDVVPAYQTIAPKQSDSSFLRRLDEGSIDVITFTSSSTVTNFLDRLDKEHHAKLDGITIACIGPITCKTAEDRGLKVSIVPEQYTVDALISAIDAYFTA